MSSDYRGFSIDLYSPYSYVSANGLDSLALETQHRIDIEISEVEEFSFPDNIRMFLTEKPANVSEEKASLSVVGIGRGLWELMVDTVVPTPLNQMIL